jgi:ubiquinone/menaquinone biosynthesis C-methylase UbiE
VWDNRREDLDAMQPNAGDTFGNAQAYEGYVGRWSQIVARQFVSWIHAPRGGHWLDVGTGTGILSQVILQEAAPASVVGVDSSPDYIDYARQMVQDALVSFRVEDAVKSAYEPAQFDVAVSGLVLNFVTSPETVTRTMTQAVRSGGLLASYVWDYSGGMEMMRHFWDAASQIDPIAKEMDAGQRFAICHPDALRALFESVGLQAVDVIPIDIQTRFKNFDDFWLPFLGAQGSVSKYLKGISDGTRAALRDQLQRQLPVAEDGQILLTARAWAAKGVVR